jgi:hypothetical protein
MLFRIAKEPADEWVIINEEGFALQPFDRKSFDAAMQSLLQ